jgi:Protein of unknown function (DUF1569)
MGEAEMKKGSLGSTADRQVIMVRLGKMRADSPRQWGKMNAHQAICHLNDSFRGVMGDIALSGKPMLIGKVVKWVALYSPLTWTRGTPTMPEVDQMKLGTKPVEFGADVAELERLVERFTMYQRDFVWKPHPFFGEMSEDDWMRWGWLHMDHHFRQFGN